ncbi:MAG: cyclodeaminase/cyclohydrolase family protein [Phycisphaerales bacterium]|nr:cyclodeaminase/cyclohydrolase family protein [Phycisphaerales bacterium]
MNIASQTIAGFLELLSAKVPTPGGGAAAAITGSTAAATAGMVVSYSINKKSLSEHQAFNVDAQEKLNTIRAQFLQLGDDDAAGYGVLNSMWKLDENDPERIAGWDDAVSGAIEPPRVMLARAVELLELCKELMTTTNKQLKSDLGVAAVLGQAAARSAAWNIRINIPLLPESSHAGWNEAVDTMLAMAGELCDAIETGCA